MQRKVPTECFCLAMNAFFLVLETSNFVAKQGTLERGKMLLFLIERFSKTISQVQSPTENSNDSASYFSLNGVQLTKAIQN